MSLWPINQAEVWPCHGLFSNVTSGETTTSHAIPPDTVFVATHADILYPGDGAELFMRLEQVSPIGAAVGFYTLHRNDPNVGWFSWDGYLLTFPGWLLRAVSITGEFEVVLDGWLMPTVFYGLGS